MAKRTFFLLALLLFFSGCSETERAPEIYRIGRDRTFYPLDLMGKERNFLAFIEDLLLEIGRHENFQVEFYIAPQNAMEVGLNNGIYDAAITSEMPTSRLQNKYEFSKPFFLVGPVLVVRISSNIDGIQDLTNKVVGIRTGSPFMSRSSDLPDIIFKSYTNTLLAMEELANDKIDAVVLGAFPAYIYTNSFYKGRLKVATRPMNMQGFRMMTLRNEKEQDFIDRFNQGLEKVIESGDFRRLLEKWELFDASRILPSKAI